MTLIRALLCFDREQRWVRDTRVRLALKYGTWQTRIGKFLRVGAVQIAGHANIDEASALAMISASDATAALTAPVAPSAHLANAQDALGRSQARIAAVFGHGVSPALLGAGTRGSGSGGASASRRRP